MPSRIEFEPLALSVAEAATQLSIGRTKVYELIHAGELKIFKIGRRTLVTFASVRELIARAS